MIKTIFCLFWLIVTCRPNIFSGYFLWFFKLYRPINFLLVLIQAIKLIYLSNILKNFFSKIWHFVDKFIEFFDNTSLQNLIRDDFRWKILHDWRNLSHEAKLMLFSAFTSTFSTCKCICFTTFVRTDSLTNIILYTFDGYILILAINFMF